MTFAKQCNRLYKMGKIRGGIKLKVIFLDVDGVLKPYYAKGRFEVDMDELRKRFTRELGVDYTIYDRYDVASASEDWYEGAVERIRNILVETNAKIVVSSDWRSKEQPYKMRDFLRIWGLHEYWYADNEYFNMESMKDAIEYVKKKDEGKDIELNRRAVEIIDFVLKHKEITNFVAIDDIDLTKYLEGHFVGTYNVIGTWQVKKAIEILNDDSLTIKR